jgi:hypothetical protein
MQWKPTMMWINHEIPLSFGKHKFMKELKELLFDKLNTEEFLQRILNIKPDGSIIQLPPNILQFEQMSLCHNFLMKLMLFLRNVSNKKKRKERNYGTNF